MVRSGFKTVTFGFADLPEQEAGALLIRPPRLVGFTGVGGITVVHAGRGSIDIDRLEVSMHGFIWW